jgi:hypothetical protein
VLGRERAEQRRLVFFTPCVLGEQAGGGEPERERVHIAANEPAGEAACRDRGSTGPDTRVYDEFPPVAARFDGPQDEP